MVFWIKSIPFIFALSNAGIAIALWWENPSSHARLLVISILSSAVGTFAYGMEIASAGLEEKLFWIIVRYSSLTGLVLMMSLWVLEFIGIRTKTRQWFTILSALIPTIALISLIAYPSSRLVYDQIWLDNSTIIPMFKKTYGPFYWVNQIYLMLLLVFMIFLVRNQFRARKGLVGKQVSIITAGFLVPVVADLLYIMNVRPWGILNLNVFSYLPMALMIWFGAQRYHLATIRPVARNMLFEQMQDGILVTDSQVNLIDINPAAQSYLRNMVYFSIGKPLEGSSPEVVQLLNVIKTRVANTVKLNGLSILVTSTPLMLAGGDYNGELTILRDISDRLEADELREAEVQRLASWRERQNIARTLHDSITQHLNGLLLLAGTAQGRLENGSYEKIPMAIGQITNAARQALADLRALINELKLENGSLQDFDLLSALTERFNTISSGAGLQVRMDLPEKLDLKTDWQREIYYILVESLNNILRHSGADQVSLQMDQSGEIFSAEIIDNGCGFDLDKPSNGMGLANMKLRARQIGADLLINSVPGSGTLIRLELPVREAAAPSKKS